MRVHSLRLSDQQHDKITALAKQKNQKTSQVIRELLDIGLRHIDQAEDSSSPSGIPKYELLATFASVEAVHLLRQMLASHSPEMVEEAQNKTRKRLANEDLLTMVKSD